jgi:hypothetical protein
MENTQAINKINEAVLTSVDGYTEFISFLQKYRITLHSVANAMGHVIDLYALYTNSDLTDEEVPDIDDELQDLQLAFIANFEAKYHFTPFLVEVNPSATLGETESFWSIDEENTGLTSIAFVQEF